MPAHAWSIVIQAFATFAMTGLIWFIQIAHYPMFRLVGESGFAAFHAAHSRLITPIVGPLMLLEAAAALWLVVSRPAIISTGLAWTGFLLVVILWLATAGLSVPQHESLARGFDAGAHSALVTTNWVRTLAWSARDVVVLLMLRSVMR